MATVRSTPRGVPVPPGRHPIGASSLTVAVGGKDTPFGASKALAEKGWQHVHGRGLSARIARGDVSAKLTVKALKSENPILKGIGKRMLRAFM